MPNPIEKIALYTISALLLISLLFFGGSRLARPTPSPSPTPTPTVEQLLQQSTQREAEAAMAELGHRDLAQQHDLRAADLEAQARKEREAQAEENRQASQYAQKQIAERELRLYVKDNRALPPSTSPSPILVGE